MTLIIKYMNKEELAQIPNFDELLNGENVEVYVYDVYDGKMP